MATSFFINTKFLSSICKLSENLENHLTMHAFEKEKYVKIESKDSGHVCVFMCRLFPSKSDDSPIVVDAEKKFICERNAVFQFRAKMVKAQ